MKKPYSNIKRFYHKGREPRVIFEAKNKIYTGFASSFWSGGLQVGIKGEPDLKPNDRISKLYIENYKTQHVVEGMKVLQLHRNNHFIYIDFYAPDWIVEKRFNLVLTMLKSSNVTDNCKQQDIIRIPKFSREYNYTEKAINARLEWARNISGAKLENVPQCIFKPESLTGNIENYIGAVQIPVGLAGPILVKGVYNNGFVPVPIATTEGALVSSISRGSMACNLAGGIHVHVNRQNMIRAPVFFCEDIYGAVSLENWILSHFEPIRQEAESISSIARLERIVPFVFGDTLHLRFYYTTGDAAGQNMTSACTLKACEWIVEQIKDDPFIKFQSFMIEGNMSGDKKANYQNLTEGRGVSVSACCRIPGDLLQRILHITAEEFVRGWQAGEVGAIQTGMIGSNINFANVIAGIFTATGQDIACVNESSIGYLKARQDGNGLVCSLFLSSLVIGTVGGGTKLPTQRDNLELMGCYGEGKLFRLGEIIAAACLALDISTGSAIAANEFVFAHEQLGRNRPSNKLSWPEVNPQFFTGLLREKTYIVEHSEKINPAQPDTVISEYVKSHSNEILGLHKYILTIRTPEGMKKVPAVLKLKGTDKEIINIGGKVAKLKGDDTLCDLYKAQSYIFNLENSCTREITFYNQAKKEILHFCPEIYGTRCDHERRIYAILMEDLSDCSHLNTVNNPSEWKCKHIKQVLSQMATMHAVYLNRYDHIPATMKIPTLDENAAGSAKDLIFQLTRFNANCYPNLISGKLLDIYTDFTNNLEDIVKKMKQFPMTLTHNDFNPGNLCLRSNGRESGLVLYDWELASFQSPQHDLVEFLIYVLDQGTPKAIYDRYTDFYFQKLQEKTEMTLSRNEFKETLNLNAVYFGLVSFNLYLLAHNLLRFPFMERIYQNLSDYILASQCPGIAVY